MDNMTFIDVSAVTWLENFMTVLIAVVITGYYNGRKMLMPINIVKYIMCITVMSSLDYFIRASSSSIIESTLLHTFMCIILTWTFLRMEWLKAYLAISMSMLFLMVLELLYIPITMSIFHIDSTFIYSNSWARFALSIPERAIQLVVALIFYKKKIVILKFNKLDKLDYITKLKLRVLGSVVTILLVIFAMSGKVFMYNTLFLGDIKLVAYVTIGFIIIVAIVLITIFTLYKSNKKMYEGKEDQYISKEKHEQVLMNVFETLDSGKSEQAIKEAKKLIEKHLKNNDNKNKGGD